TEVYVDGRKLGSAAGFVVDRFKGSFRDRNGHDHILEVKAGMVDHKVFIDGSLVWQGGIPARNTADGCLMGLTLLLGIAACIAIPFFQPWLLFAAIPLFALIVLALVRRGLMKGKARQDNAQTDGDRRTKMSIGF